MFRQASSRAQPSGSPRTEAAHEKSINLSVRPELVEGPEAITTQSLKKGEIKSGRRIDQ
jgi:hypothetical protein